MRLRTTDQIVVGLLAVGIWMTTVPARATTTLKSICRIKGQEEISLHGQGIVVGLKGTGDGGQFGPTARSLAKALELMGRALGPDGLAELKNAENVATVMITVTIPAAGARQGDKISCQVSAIAAKSLEGGRLLLAPLMGGLPDVRNPRVYAFAQGPISLDDPDLTTTGRIYAGCQLEEDFINEYTKDGKITLVLDTNHADFQVAQDVAELINSQLSFQSSGLPLAKAIDQVNIEVDIPPQYKEDSVLFVSQVLSLPMLEPQVASRVTINERAGTIVISGDVEIGAVVVTHKNIVIEAGNALGANRFTPLDLEETPSPKLKALVEALDAVHVPTEDMVDIIKALDRNGKLHAHLIIE